MTSSATYWVCSCGKAQPLSARICAECGKKRPRSKKWAIIGIAVGILAISMALLGGPAPKPIEYPAKQRAFLTALKSYEERWAKAPNALVRKELLAERDRALAQTRSVDSWVGIVLGVSSMYDGIGVAIDIGGPHILAGTYETKWIDTTISRSNGSLVGIVERLKSGTRVKVSGQFEVNAGSLVEISYTDHGSARTPQYLIRFNAITSIEK